MSFWRVLLVWRGGIRYIIEGGFRDGGEGGCVGGF